jgi:putative resolvase
MLQCGPEVAGGVGLYARVSSHGQKPELERQVARLSGWAAQAGHRVVRVESEVGSGMNGARSKARRLLADPDAVTVVVERRDRLGRMNTELVEAAPAAVWWCWRMVKSKMTWSATWLRC